MTEGATELKHGCKTAEFTEPTIEAAAEALRALVFLKSDLPAEKQQSNEKADSQDKRKEATEKASSLVSDVLGTGSAWLSRCAREVFSATNLLSSPLAADKFMLQCRSSFGTLAETTIRSCRELFLDHLERAHFKYFEDFSDPDTGLTKDRSTENSPCSIAGVGFSLSSHLAAAERGWTTREKAADYTLKVLRTLWNSPQGAGKEGVAGHKGFFYHFLDPKKGTRTGDSELSTVDTALLMAGVLSSAEYFHGDTEKEKEIRSLAKQLYERVDWNWAMRGEKHMSMGWYPDTGFIDHSWKGYNEAMILMVLAMASPTHPIPAKSWKAYTKSYEVAEIKGQPYINFGPMFGHQYSHAWIDFKGIRDKATGKLGIDYFENSRRAVQAQVEYASDNPMAWRGYSKLNWGVTASDGPGLELREYAGKKVQFHAYRARGPGEFDDGTLAPTAVAASLPFAPELTLPTLAYWSVSRPELWSAHGFKDAFNPSFNTTKPSGWVASDTLAIDQGPIVMMIENYRSGLFWKLMKNSKPISDGLKKAGFSGGWLKTTNGPG